MSSVCICGSRNFPHMDTVREIVRALPRDLLIIVGGAPGVDKVAEEEARALGFEIKVFPALWGTYGKRAGAIRNRQMVEAADRVIAFWDGQSKGTKITIDIATAMNKPLYLIEIER